MGSVVVVGGGEMMTMVVEGEKGMVGWWGSGSKMVLW